MMYKTKLILTLAAAIAVFALPVYGGGEKPKRPAFQDQYDIRLNIPKVVRRNLTDRVQYLAMKTYPDAVPEQVHADIEKVLMTSSSYNLRVSRDMGTSLFIPPGGKTNISISISFPAAWQMGVGTRDPFTGKRITTPDKPLSEEKAQRVAKAAMRRLFSNDTERERFKEAKAEFWEAFGNYRFLWVDDSLAQKGGGKRIVTIVVQKNDGIIAGEGISRLTAPKVSQKEITEVAAKAISGFKATNLWLGVHRWYSAEALAWHYAEPDPKKGRQKGLTVWDAQTGKVLYSEILEGGKADKPYRSKEFYFEPTLKAVKGRLQKAIDARVKELNPAAK
ncbi:MAG: hypothetical protein QF662_00325 [Phycisphaerae bacterium]|nr:hypothetical protein [Phycisphaerae bacterium]